MEAGITHFIFLIPPMPKDGLSAEADGPFCLEEGKLCGMLALLAYLD
jgi:hypothetical protein